MKHIASIRLASTLALLLLGLAGAHAQTPAANKDSLSDSERAKRDAEKVFSFIKFHTVKPAAPTAPAAKPQAAALAAQAAPAAVRATAAPTPSAAAATAPSAAAVAAATAHRQAASTAQPAPAVASNTAAPAGGGDAAALNAAAAAAPSTAAGLAAATAAPAAVTEPEPEPEPEEVPLKLIAYTAPEMNGKVMQALGERRIVVPVRFKVEADGHVSAASALGNAPRAIEQSAVRAVQQWKFDKLPASREVDVEIAFKAGD